MADAFVHILDKFHIAEKTLAISADNATKMDTFGTELERLYKKRNVTFTASLDLGMCQH